MTDSARDSSAGATFLHRRAWLQWAAAASCGALAGRYYAAPQVEHHTAPQMSALNRYPRMVHQWYVDQVRLAQASKLQRMEQLRSKRDAEAYIASIKRRIRSCFGANPKRTPLNARVTGTVQREAYRIEKVVFDSRPGFSVAANLYIPSRRPGLMPGVVGTCGHSTSGKATEACQSFAQGLARLGYVCLIFDPIGQGERLQYVNAHLNSYVGEGVDEHLQAGNQQFLVGDFLGMWRVWDGIRALDYLLTRPEVDKQHVGITGHSGGGTATTWSCGLEPRWTMAAPNCFVTTCLHNLENELPADTEQCPPMALALGLDHDDFIAVMAPKPVILLAKERDFFDIRGTEEAFGRLKHLYRLLGKEENIQMFTGRASHEYSQENREAMYRWFNRATHVSDALVEPEITIEKEETLWCTPRGQVAALPTNKMIFQFTGEKAAQLEKTRGNRSGQALAQRLTDVLSLPADCIPRSFNVTRGRSEQEPREHGQKARKRDHGAESDQPRLSQASGEPRSAIPSYSIWRYLGDRGYPGDHAIAYAVQTEPGIDAIVYRLTDQPWYSRPPQSGKRAILYVAHLSSDDELRDESLIRGAIAAEPTTPLYTCDVRGIGESMPRTIRPDSFHDPYGSDYFYAIHGLMLDRPYLGRQTYDVLRVLDWLQSLGHDQIHLIGRGRGAFSATFAAILSPAVRQVTLKNALSSYGAVAKSEHYHWPLAMLPPNVLAHFDLPDCYRELESKQLHQIDPWGPLAGMKQSVSD